MSQQKWLNDVLQIRKSKKGKIYVSITEDADLFDSFVSRLKPGAAIMCRKTTDDLEESLNAGKIDETRYEELLEKLDWIKYKGSMGPETN